MTEVNTVKHALLNEQLVVVSEGAQHRPHCLRARLLNEQGVKEQEPLERQTILVQALHYMQHG